MAHNEPLKERSKGSSGNPTRSSDISGEMVTTNYNQRMDDPSMPASLESELSSSQDDQSRRSRQEYSHSATHIQTVPASTSSVEIGTVKAEETARKLLDDLQEDSKTVLKMMNRMSKGLHNLSQKAFYPVNHEEVIHERNLLKAKVKDLEDEVAKLRKELEVQSVILTHTADGASGTDVIAAMGNLNEEIYQFAASLAEEYEKYSRERRKINWEVSTVHMRDEDSKAIISFVRLAEEKELEHALQTCIIACCTPHLTSLIPFNVTSDVNDAYRVIRLGEEQGVSGKWRSLVCRHVTKDGTEQVIQEKLCEFLGWSRGRSTSQHVAALQSIASKLFSLHKAIYTDVLSGDIKVIFPMPGNRFDPKIMETADKHTEGKPISCTTEMGLIKYIIEKKYSDGRWNFLEYWTVMLKAKVAFHDSLRGSGRKLFK